MSATVTTIRELTDFLERGASDDSPDTLAYSSQYTPLPDAQIGPTI